jgi:hypothetical protein
MDTLAFHDAVKLEAGEGSYDTYGSGERDTAQAD